MIRRFIILAVTIVGIILISFYEIYIAIIMVMFIVTILVILLSHARFGKSKLSNRSTNIVMTILIAFATMQVFTLMVIGSSNVIQVTVVGNYLNSVYQQDELPLALEELGIYKSDEYPRRGSYLDISETFIAKKVFFSDSFGSSDGYYKNLDSGVLYPFIRVSVFESNYAWVVNKYRELYFSDREEFNISPMDYSTLYEQGYDGYIAEVKGRFELMLVIDMKSIHIVSHEKLTEENILLILSSI